MKCLINLWGILYHQKKTEGFPKVSSKIFLSSTFLIFPFPFSLSGLSPAKDTLR